MFESIFVVLGAAVLYLLFRAISKANEENLPSISDEVFLEEFHKLYDFTDSEFVITEREALAQYFNIDRSKISVDVKLADLAKSFSMTSGYVALNDIAYDLLDLNNNDNNEDIEVPETAGELVNLFLTLKYSCPVPRNTQQSKRGRSKIKF